MRRAFSIGVLWIAGLLLGCSGAPPSLTGAWRYGVSLEAYDSLPAYTCRWDGVTTFSQTGANVEGDRNVQIICGLDVRGLGFQTRANSQETGSLHGHFESHTLVFSDQLCQYKGTYKQLGGDFWSGSVFCPSISLNGGPAMAYKGTWTLSRIN
jgi:hypothetical protein